MELDEYQRESLRTDQFPERGQRGESISLFGLIGEIGSLISTFKKRIRDKSAYETFHDDLREELGDVLWYLANLAHKYDMRLEEVARLNLEKTQALWLPSSVTNTEYTLYDGHLPVSDQLPRRVTVTFTQSGEISDAGYKKVRIGIDGMEIGDPLTDNAYANDGYRFHDCFHLSYAAILGWSPVLRRMSGHKRKTRPKVDEVEDGARASFTEEFISLYVYNYARNHNYFEVTNQIDEEVLRTIKTLVKGLEVENRTAFEWRTAVLEGFKVFRLLREHNGGKVSVDLTARSITFEEG